MSLLQITKKFVSHVNSLERLLNYSRIIKQQYNMNDDGDDLSINDIFHLILEVKSIELIKDKEDLIDEQKEVLEEYSKISGKNKMARYIYKNIDVQYNDEGEISYNLNSALVNKFVREQVDKNHNYFTDMTQLKNSIIISLVTSMELLIAEIFRDFIENIDQSGFLDKKSLTYLDLLKIGGIDQAKQFLIDKHIEEMLRNSFSDWISEIEKTLKIKIKSVDSIEENKDLELINETFQRRHLFIHNGGIINDLYLSKVDDTLTEGLEKGEEFETSYDYIIKSINIFRKVGIILLFLYGKKRYKRKEDEIFSQLNNIFLELAVIGCEGANYVYREIANDSNFSHESQLMSKFNYYLSNKLNSNFDEVRDELKRFNVDTLSTEFKMAKHILLDEKEEAIKHFKIFSESLEDDYFVHIIEWPLIKIIRNEEEVKKYIHEKLDKIISLEGSEKVENIS